MIRLALILSLALFSFGCNEKATDSKIDDKAKEVKEEGVKVKDTLKKPKLKFGDEAKK